MPSPPFRGEREGTVARATGRVRWAIADTVALPKWAAQSAARRPAWRQNPRWLPPDALKPPPHPNPLRPQGGEGVWQCGKLAFEVRSHDYGRTHLRRDL